LVIVKLAEIARQSDTRHQRRVTHAPSITSFSVAALALAIATPAWAGPPFLSDDPDPTPRGEYEILLFAEGEPLRGDQSGSTGIDFNFGATPDLQLTAAAPYVFEDIGGGREWELGNIELAAKLRILHQETFGWDVAIFPRVFLPSASDLGDQHASLLLPVWLGRESGRWSTFGGGGCAINRGDDAQDYCLAGWAVAYDVTGNFNLGAEVFHQTADVKAGKATTTLGLGGAYDVNETVHLLGYLGADPDHLGDTEHTAWYTSLLFTF
jgi:hypothetical protein